MVYSDEAWRFWIGAKEAALLRIGRHHKDHADLAKANDEIAKLEQARAIKGNGYVPTPTESPQR